MIWIIIECVLVLISHAIVGIYSAEIKYSKKITYIIWCIWIVVQGMLMVYSEINISYTIIKFLNGFLLSLLGQYAIFFLTTNGRITQRIFTMMTYSIFFCIVMSFITIVKGSFIGIHPIFNIIIQSVTLFLVLFYFLYYICPLCRSASKNITTGWKSLILVDVVFMITVVLSSIFPVKLTSFRDLGFFPFLFLSISIMSVFPIIFLNINNMSEVALKKEVEAQNQILLAQIEAKTAQLMADSHSRHDRRHHNLVMLEYANKNDIESVRNYLKTLVDTDVISWNEIQYCENITVNTVLTVYSKRAKDNGILVKISAKVNQDITILPQDIVIVIGNLFENAIYATSNLEDNNKQIDINIREDSQRLLIKVENPCKDKRSFDEKDFGVGIRSVISTINKYDGMYDFEIKNDTFYAKISLNIK